MVRESLEGGILFTKVRECQGMSGKLAVDMGK